MTKLEKLMRDVFNRVKIDESPYLSTARYVPSKDYPDDEEHDARVDFPYLVDPKGYVTNRPLEQTELEEQNDKKEKPVTPEEAGAEAGAEDIDISTPEGGAGGIGDTGMDAAGNIPGVAGGDLGVGMGMPGQEPLTVSQLGRVYELKKIYSRLSSVETFLARTTDGEMLQIRKLVSQAIDLFELVISNYMQYKDKIDDIIVTYYKFLEAVYDSLKDYFSDISKE